LPKSVEKSVPNYVAPLSLLQGTYYGRIIVSSGIGKYTMPEILKPDTLDYGERGFEGI
jgi:hypothetical protein